MNLYFAPPTFNALCESEPKKLHMNWQPIETAPRDRHFLAFGSDGGGSCMAVCYYTSHGYLDVAGAGGWEMETEIVPSHWAELPEPPA